jgi:hypothetical protein
VTAAAPFPAAQTLQQLAKDEVSAFPMASVVALHDFYDYDLMSSTDPVESGLHVQSKLNSMMDRGGFSLRKWSSNSPELLDSIPAEQEQSTWTFP